MVETGARWGSCFFVGMGIAQGGHFAVGGTRQRNQGKIHRLKARGYASEPLDGVQIFHSRTQEADLRHMISMTREVRGALWWWRAVHREQIGGRDVPPGSIYAGLYQTVEGGMNRM